jgi:D-alanyl-D-alanine carboxypeptidase
MCRVRFEATYGLHGFVLGLAALTAAVTFFSDSADARRYRRVHVQHGRHAIIAPRAARAYRHFQAEGYSPPTSSIVVDGNTGAVLHASNADALRHPASLTKIMTLYLLFERLDAGKIRLDTQLKISEHAAEQAPTKLGLKPGQTIVIEDAIKAIVTKSANDAAVAIAENLGGDESGFAKLMTEKAHALGMTRTTYVNASGLPDDDQVTSAQDQALLGRAIQARFPHFYKYFSTEAFVYRGVAMRNHNHLLGVVGGVDGIKTGYTRASGFNLVTSVHRDGRFIVAVVLGGRSAGERDAHMRQLINEHIKEALLRQSAPAIAEKTEQRGDPKPAMAEKAKQRGETKPIASVKVPLASAHTDSTAMVTVKANGKTTAGNTDPIQPLLVRTITYRTAPVQAAPLAPMPSLVPTPASLPVPAAAPPVRTAPAAQLPEPPSTVVVASTEAPSIAGAPQAKAESPKTEQAKPEPAKSEPAKPALASAEPSAAQIRARGGWIIQIGAFEGEDEAKEHLSDARHKAPTMLAAADPFTERVRKGDKALYRARFAGFERAMAEAACKQLKRSDIACITVKN